LRGLKNKYFLLFVISGVLIVVDQYTKFMVTLHIHLNGSVEVIEGLFNLIHIRNSGVAFGFVRPHRRLPTRLPRPWDSPGKNTGVDCHFLLQCMKVKSESEVSQSCLTPSDPMDCSPPGSYVQEDFPGKSTGVG